jgi:hypothetical protein
MAALNQSYETSAQLVRYKLVFFSPPEPLEKIKSAIFATGAGVCTSSKKTPDAMADEILSLCQPFN